MGFHGEVRVQCGFQNLEFIRELNVCPSDITGIETGKRFKLLRSAKQDMATDFAGLRAMPFSQNQVRLKRSNILIVICRKKRHIELSVICILLLRDLV